MYCSFCGSRTHTLGTCPKRACNAFASRRKCQFCGVAGHTFDNCPRRWANVESRRLEKLKREGKFDGADLCTEHEGGA